MWWVYIEWHGGVSKRDHLVLESWNEDVVLGEEFSDCGEIGAALTGDN